MKEDILKQSKKEIIKRSFYLVFAVVILSVTIIVLINSGDIWNKLDIRSDKSRGYVFFLGIAIGCMIYNIRIIINKKKLISDLYEEKYKMAFDELDDSSTVSYYNAGIYLTKHYLLYIVAKQYCILPYEDIVWIYLDRRIPIKKIIFRKKFIFREELKVGNYVRIHTNFGKIYEIGGETLADDNYAYKTICNRCYQVNPHIEFDYSDGNKAEYKAMREKIKQIKKAGNDPRNVFRPSDIEHTPL